MNLEKRLKDFQEEREILEKKINRGIWRYNTIHNEDVETIEESYSGYDTPVEYTIGENGITIKWFEDIGRCGETKYEDCYKTIPFHYFEEDEDLEKIEADLLKKKNFEKKLDELIHKEIEINSKRLNLERDIRELSSVSNKHNIDASKQIKYLINEKDNTLKELKRYKNLISAFKKKGI